MSEKKLEGLYESSLNGLKSMVDVSTVVGEPINTADGTTIIPYSRVSFGYGMGGAENDSEADGSGLVGGSGGGVTVQPIGFLIISNGETKMINVDSQNPIEKLIECVPSIIDSISSIFHK